MRALQRVAEIVPHLEFGSPKFCALFDRADCDILCHHAARVTDYRSPDFNVNFALAENTNGFKALSERLAARACAAVVLTGSVFEPDDGAGTEPRRAFSPYGLSKALTASVIRYWCEIAGLPFGKFVIANPFGPIEEPRFCAYLIILRTAFGLFPFGGESGIFSGMTQDLPPIAVHPTGEQSTVALGGAAAAPQPLVVDSFAGSVRVEWDHATAFTPLGQLPFFIDFLKTAGLFDSFVADSPLNYESPNASKTRDVLGTAMLSMLAGHKRYSHIAALRGDGVLPELLGMRKIVSEDSVRRAFAAIEEEAGAAWMRRHLDHCLEPLLSERWILDIDTTVKPLYGRQEGAVVGYNPKKPGRPSHCYHTYSMAGTRLVIDVDVCAGDEHASNHAAPALWALLDRTARDCWPTLLRGDKGFGNEKILREAELRALAYLFKLRLTANVRRAIERLSQQSEWVDSGQGWQAKETQVRLKGWSRQRRIIVLRRRVKGELATPSTDEAGQRRLTFVDILPSEELWEYQVLVTSLVEQLGSFGQLYRDRADGENIFDELKNQWGWGGFVTQDLARCRLAARMVALFYDWWNIFVRLAEPDWRREAITSRPLLLHAIAERVRHARQTTIRIASMHARSVPAAEALRAVAKFLRGLVETAEQLAPLHRWREILSRAFQAFLKGRPLRAPLRLKPG